MIFAMVVLGGVTRLTGSGLSIVEWKPLLGIVPPLNAGEWEELFRKYRQFPEYRLLNPGMTLAEFKTIFWIEYAHRLWGRLIGLVFLVPFLYFLVKGALGERLRLHLAVILVLGGLQGLLGWYMVKSGLDADPAVSQYRLAAHLASAFLIYGYILWIALGLLAPRRGPDPAIRGLRRFALVIGAVTFLTVLSGAFVAGLDAGLAYNTFPLMDGRLAPAEIFMLRPLVLNFFANVATVQFDHRWLATILVVLVLLLWLKSWSVDLPARTRAAFHLLLAVAFLQAGLGIATLVLVVPVSFAAAHQAGALMLFSFALWVAHELRPGPGNRGI
ncbi:MAG: COX15/CtaA family protein [Alphaproteobacteria bacterium]